MKCTFELESYLIRASILTSYLFSKVLPVYWYDLLSHLSILMLLIMSIISLLTLSRFFILKPWTSYSTVQWLCLILKTKSFLRSKEINFGFISLFWMLCLMSLSLYWGWLVLSLMIENIEMRPLPLITWIISSFDGAFIDLNYSDNPSSLRSYIYRLKVYSL